MDYGKLAYLNTEDLNKRLQSLEQNTRTTPSSISLSKTLNANITDNYTFDVRFSSSKEPITVIGKLKFFHTAPNKADITIKLNGMVCYFDTAEFLSNEKEYLFFFCVQGQTNNTLEFNINKSGYFGKLISYDLIITGGNVKGFEPDINIALISRPSNNAVGCKIGSKICCYVSGSSEFDFSVPSAILGEGQDFSLCQGYDDIDITAFLKVTDKNILKFKTLQSYELDVDTEVTSCAVIPIAIGYLTVYIKNGRAFYRIVYPTYQVSQAFEISMPTGTLETVRAVLDAVSPMFLFKTSDNKIYLKTDNTVMAKENLSNITISGVPFNAS